MSEKSTIRAASYLSPPDFHRLNWACRPVRKAFDDAAFGVYLVGSVLRRPDFRDIDLRLICRSGDDYARIVLSPEHGLLLNIAISDLIAKTAGLAWPIDFQVQPRDESREYDTLLAEHPRNPMGLPR